MMFLKQNGYDVGTNEKIKPAKTRSTRSTTTAVPGAQIDHVSAKSQGNLLVKDTKSFRISSK